MSDRELTNFLRETLECLADNGKSMDDVQYITGGGYNISKDDFIRVAAGIEYYDGFGHQYIPSDLKIVGNGWWLERGEYDGSEWWEFRTLPLDKKETRKLIRFDLDKYDDRKYVFQEANDANA